ncbi:Ger(x)C family spore germination protein [Ferviditalea candida]|uniref:Ger(X)C family spore germination protein n=1 Tax=Ferviditalea candida TaxID=3108399 RepID=A0ABU5ZP03_9BACL|nr:Ger(x)C family spore germination protein [Paenibacillaceae bacterium T2]
MKATKWISILLLVLPLTGCWSKYEAQNINYATAVGVDYEKGKYTLYVQMLDFSTVAKMEGQQKSEEVPVWLGKGSGISFTDAANDLYSTSQQRVSWGQVSAMVFSERLLEKQKIHEVLELFNRYREFRYLPWLFSTQDSLDEILTATPFFKLSPKASILHNPEQNYRQRSILPPVRLYQFVQFSNEKAKLGYIPELGINKKQWKENQKPHELLEYRGIQLYDHNKYYGRMTMPDLKGLPWMNQQTVRLPLSLFKDGKLAAVLVAEKPKVKITPTVRNEKAYFDVTVNIRAGINELHQHLSNQEITKMAQREIEAQIEKTFKIAYGKKIDIYDLGESLYRKDPAAWSHIAGHNQFILNENSLLHLNVKVKVIYPGRYKSGVIN